MISIGNSLAKTSASEQPRFSLLCISHGFIGQALEVLYKREIGRRDLVHEDSDQFVLGINPEISAESAGPGIRTDAGGVLGLLLALLAEDAKPIAEGIVTGKLN